jgi:hypothetical protein
MGRNISAEQGGEKDLLSLRPLRPGWRESERARIMKIFWCAAVILALALAAGMAYRAMQPRSPVPEQLLGVWKTDNSAYADRYFKVGRDSIEVGQGEGSVTSQSIFRVDTKTQDGHISCLIRTYSFEPSYQPADKHEEQWLFEYDPAGRGTIHLKSQPKVIWRKETSANLSSSGPASLRVLLVLSVEYLCV